MATLTTTIRLSEVYGENARYCDPDSAAAIEGLPADAWGALVAACEEMQWGDEPGIGCSVAKTYENLDDFDLAREKYWSERGARTEMDIEGHKAIKYERCQMRKGQQRFDQIVIDLGPCRAALSL